MLSDVKRGQPAATWSIVIACAALMAITTGIRLSLGLFVRPIAATGIGIGAISLVLAIGQFWWGAVQPLFGLLAERISAQRVLKFGGLLLGLGLALAPVFPTKTGLLFTLGILSAAGAGAASFAILIGAAAQRLPPERRAFASGVINAGGSLGQFLMAPLVQIMISTWGWAIALWGLAAAGFASVFLARPAAGPVSAPITAAAAGRTSAREELGRAFRNRSYLCLHLGFFTCGFHIAFLVTHLPSEIALCGLPSQAAGVALGLIGLFNIAGSILIGWLGGRYRMKILLAELYAVRAAVIVIYLFAPKTVTTLYVFSGALGMTWLATVPPTAGLVGKLFGTTRLSTLFGMTLFSHQVGAFFGAWLGGVAMSLSGSYEWVWYADAALAILAALVTLPIREAVAGDSLVPHASAP
jgi:predicted MFS family arabinose efflux permease